MKSVRSSSLGALALALLLGATSIAPQLIAASPTTSTAADPYTTAVNNYVEAATNEMAVVRKELETAEKLGKKEAFAGARAVFDKCNALVARLKTASRGEFDPTKAEYERNRAILQSKLKEARHAQVPATPAAAATPAPAKH